ncbi:PREDICTED: transmembrane protein 256-like [Rhagoletis zephyria]|uniref:transmembrane protein 256-like n=1 Tax=Rhagoletis zephyria TaxID=28612 RepID=UPI00081187F2|nr:PREDICTED: transmembrane protein 256-like [Rhagoletis zephyria]
MTFTDYLHYVTIGNPVSKAVVSGVSSLYTRGTAASTSSSAVKTTTDGAATKVMGSVIPPLWKLAGRNHNFVRLAGLSGASAVILGAIGSHKLPPSHEKDESKTIFETANRFHFFHSLVLLGAPLARYPALTGTLIFTGTFLFSGTLYYRAFTGDKRFARFAPYGGFCLIVGWLTLLL